MFDQIWQRDLALDPVRQGYLGIDDNNHLWTDNSEAARRARLDASLADLRRLKKDFDPAALSAQDLLSLQLFERGVRRDEEGWRWRHHSYPVNQMYGDHRWFSSFLINIHRVRDADDARAYVARLEGMPAQLERVVQELRVRSELGVTPPAFVFPKVLDDCAVQLRGRPFEDDASADGVLLADFRAKVTALQLPEDQQQALLADAEAALRDQVAPAYRLLVREIERQQGLATTDDGAWKLPDGADYYDFRLQQITTTALSAAQIHQLGLDQVDRIHGEMRAIMAQVGFEGDLRAFFEFMRSDPRFYLEDSEQGRAQYLAEAERVIREMEARLPEAFITTPKGPLQVQRVEPWRERSAGKAFYRGGTPDGSRPGTYYANLVDMADMPTYQLQALAYHEGIPGHHLQITIARELQGLPEFRKHNGFTAYSEGWGLYSEYLPKEMGLYTDPYADFGRLAMELWRACRLVVDTGIHEQRWSREQAIDYLMQNTPNPRGDAVKAIERYIVMPGQATGYMVGKLRILALREQAKQALGPDFDLRRFHEEVLTSGPLPMGLLEQQVQGWVEAQGGRWTREGGTVAAP